MSEVKTNPPLPTDTVPNRADLPFWQVFASAPHAPPRATSNFQISSQQLAQFRARHRPPAPAVDTLVLPDDHSRCRLRPCRLVSR